MKKIGLKLVIFLLVISGLVSSCSTEELVQDVENTSIKKTIDENSLNADNGAFSRVTTYKVKQYVFLRPEAVFGAGHVGVGYEIRTYFDGVQNSVEYIYGGVENSRGAAVVIPGQNNGGWSRASSTGASMLNYMKDNYGYSKYKFKTALIALSSSQKTNALNRVIAFPYRGYIVANNNCMNASYDVLIDLGTSGVTWPSSWDRWAPGSWYGDLTIKKGWSGSKSI